MEGKMRNDLPLMAHTLKLRLILRIALDPQARRKHKLPDRGAEARKERIERLPPAKHPY